MSDNHVPPTAPTPHPGGPVVTFGEVMGLFSADRVGPMRPGRTFTMSFGGSESNVAIGIRRLGGAATWMGMVGADPLGDLILRELRAEGVTVRARRHRSAPTSIMVKDCPTAHRTRVQYYRAEGAGSRFNVEDLDLDAVRSAAALHVTGITAALSERMTELLITVMDVARGAGVPVSFDLNYRARLWSRDRARDAYRRLLPHADLVFAGVAEAEIALDRTGDPADLAGDLAGHGPTQVIVTLGADGALSLVDGQLHRDHPTPVSAVDSVGAGDAFVAGYLTEFLGGAAPVDRLRLGNALGAHICQVPGDWEGLPFRADLVASTDPVLR